MKYQYEDITAFRILSKILSNTNQKYPSIMEMSHKKDELYDVDINFSHSFYGKLSLLKMSCSYIHPSYIPNKNYEKQVFQLLHDCLFQPNIQKGQFDQSMYEIAKI